MKKYFWGIVVMIGITAIFLLSASADVSEFALSANGASAGSWTWDDDTVSGTIIPQYQLTAGEDDYAVPQSNGLAIDGATRICHPYPNGQFGWTAEIRVLTNSGWQAVPTVNAWVPDEEGQYMTCANVWYRGTYAVFGYWEKPEGWISTYCATVPTQYDVYVGTVDEIYGHPEYPPEINYTVRCAQPGDASYVAGGLFVDDLVFHYTLPLPEFGRYCGCEKIYKDSSYMPPSD